MLLDILYDSKFVKSRSTRCSTLWLSQTIHLRLARSMVILWIRKADGALTSLLLEVDEQAADGAGHVRGHSGCRSCDFIAHTYIHRYTHRYTHTYIHIYIHTHIFRTQIIIILAPDTNMAIIACPVLALMAIEIFEQSSEPLPKPFHKIINKYYHIYIIFTMIYIYIYIYILSYTHTGVV